MGTSRGCLVSPDCVQPAAPHSLTSHELSSQGEVSACINVDDAFGRMLVHGIAQFHGLPASTNKSPACSVTVHSRERRTLEGACLIKCTDVLLALAEVGTTGLTLRGLQSFLSQDGGVSTPQVQG